MVVVPSRKVTVPVGVPGERLVTVAVNVMLVPAVTVVAEDVRATAVGAPVGATLKVYEAIAPTSGLPLAPVFVEVASWPSVAKAYRTWVPLQSRGAVPLKLPALPVARIHGP